MANWRLTVDKKQEKR